MGEVRAPIALEQLRIASACRASWDAMQPVDGAGPGIRRCDACGLHVHNLALMDGAQIDAFLRAVRAGAATGKRVCAMLTRRADGTVIVGDCPVGVRLRLRRAAAGAVRMSCALTSVALGIAWGIASRHTSSARLGYTEPFVSVRDRLESMRPTRYMTMGAVSGPTTFSPFADPRMR